MAEKKTDELTEVQKQIAKMLEDAKAEAKQIVEDAKAEAKKAVEEAKAESDAKASAEREEDRQRGEELVEIKLFKDNDKYKDPVFVGCNGETVAIERGVKVKVKRKFAEILENSDKQDYETARMIERKSDEFAKSGL